MPQMRGCMTDPIELGRLAPEQLCTEHEFIKAVLDMAPALILVRDHNGRIVRFNKACEAASGYSLNEVKDMCTWDLLVIAEEIPLVKHVFENCKSERGPIVADIHWRHRDGSRRLISWCTTTLRDGNGTMLYVVGVGADITEQRRIEEIGREREREIAHLHRLLTAESIAGVLAHELNQPLAAIAFYCDIATEQNRHGAVVPKDVMRNFEDIRVQASRAAHVVANLRSFMSKSKATKTAARLSHIVHTVTTLIEPRAMACGVTLETDVDEGLSPVWVVPVQIEHVLVNLINNSIDAIQHAGMPSGTIRVKVQAQQDEFSRVTVRDTGPGLDASALEEIFQPLYTTRPDGLGLGLQISRSIIEAHGGKLWAEESARGAVFHATLPLASDDGVGALHPDA
jgi:PAS domain S-box-containing protein